MWRAAALVLIGIIGCGGGRPEQRLPAEPFLAVWAGDADRKHTDFLAILDAESGKVVRTIPVKSAGNEPQGVTQPMRSDGRLFATGMRTNRVFVFDLRSPKGGKLLRVVEPGESRRLAAPRAAASLANGNVAVACADRVGYRGSAREVLRAPGGLLELTADGRVVGERSAGSQASAPYVVAPTGVAVGKRPALVVTTNYSHGLAPTTRRDHPMVVGITVQGWDASRLRPRTIAPLPPGPRGDENLGPFSARFIGDGSQVLVNTYDGGGLYLSDSLSIEGGHFRLVHDFGRDSKPSGAVVTPDGRWYVTALAGRQSVVALDVRDPWKPRQASSVRLDQVPTGEGEGTVRRKGGPGDVAVSANGERVAVSNYTVDGPSVTVDGDRRVYVLRLDAGKLRIDTRFRDEDSGEVGVDFNRAEWPHGKTGPARPRGLVFVAPARE
jgi:hypothetical protein